MISVGFRTLLYKEILRFWKVLLQTLLAPALATLLYLVVFAGVMAGRPAPFSAVNYVAFLVPGLAMMAVIQNAFANTSSSIIQSKITGNIVFVLLPPLSYLEFFTAFVVAAVIRGLLVGLMVCLVALPVAPGIEHPLWLLAFALVSAFALGAIGVIAGIWADKFDQLAGVQNFLILPLSFLSGAFYSVHELPALWAAASHFNPFFYMVDGFRFGFLGAGDVSPAVGLVISTAFAVSSGLLAVALLRKGYKLRS